LHSLLGTRKRLDNEAIKHIENNFIFNVNFFKKRFAKKKKLLSLQPLNEGYKKEVHRKIENILKINVEQNIQKMFFLIEKRL